LTARTVKIKIRWPDFKTLTRQSTLVQPTADGEIIAKTAIDLFKKNWQRGLAVRLLGVGVSGLDKVPRQMGLWDVNWEKERKIQDILAEFHEKFGANSISRGMPDNES